MSDWTGLMTKLQATNISLNSIGSSSVEDVEAGGLDAVMASDIVDETSAYVQAEGWNWNRETVKASPDADGFLVLPANVIDVDTTGTSKSIDVVQRGLKLYDRGNNTFVFPAGTYYLDITYNLEWDDLPQIARTFIAASAAMVLQERTLGNDLIDKDLQQKAKDAWVKLVRADLRDGDYNMLKDNWSAQSVVNRSFFSRGAYL